MKPPTGTCRTCGTAYDNSPAQGRPRLYCSQRCASAAQTHRLADARSDLELERDAHDTTLEEFRRFVVAVSGMAGMAGWSHIRRQVLAAADYLRPRITR